MFDMGSVARVGRRKRWIEGRRKGYLAISDSDRIYHAKLRWMKEQFCQQRRRRNGEAGALHVGGMGAVGLGHGAQERKDVLGNDLEHGSGIAVLQPRPAHVLIGHAAVLADLVFACGKNAPLDRLAEPRGLALFEGVRVVQPAHEQEVGDLLDHLQRIGDATRPEGVPDVVDLGVKFACQHVTHPNLFRSPAVAGAESRYLGKIS